jgi:Holliday junction resolvase
VAKNSKSKGTKFERELSKMLIEKGYLVVRAAGSGILQTAPDLLAFRSYEHIAFECKAWDSERLSLRPEQYKLLQEWSDNAGLTVYVAWRVPREGWFFIKLYELNENRAISLSHARLINRRFEEII